MADEYEYHVGRVDLFLPIGSINKNRTGSDDTNNDNGDNDDNDDHVSVRLLYPIDTDRADPPSAPYMDPGPDGYRICDEMMRIGTPPPLNKAGWLFHYLTLGRSRGVRRNAPLAKNKKGSNNGNGNTTSTFPTEVYSHGLLGCAGCYLQQGLTLAAEGRVVVMPNHADGSAVLTKRKDGTYQYYVNVDDEVSN